MTLFKGGIIDNTTSTLIANDTVTLSNVFELMEDQNYTVIVSFGYLEASNIIETEHVFGMFDVKKTFINNTIFHRHIWCSVTECY